MTAPDTQARPAWPYPRWIAHRGAGLLAPENTLAAFACGAHFGYRMIECDVKLSADGVPFLLHDDHLERTTNGQGVAGQRDWSELSPLDAGSWHSPAFRGEPLPTLAAVAAWCQAHGVWLNIEIKPSPGTAVQTGHAVALAAARCWNGHPQTPLLTSFSTDALAAASTAAPGLPRGLLLETMVGGWVDTARGLGCVAVVAHHPLWNPGTMAQAQRAGLRTGAFTVNDAKRVQDLLTMRLDSLITDRVDLFNPV